ncbi:hypothetical protein [Flagellimonas sp. 2504JD4-2]
MEITKALAIRKKLFDKKVRDKTTKSTLNGTKILGYLIAPKDDEERHKLLKSLCKNGQPTLYRILKPPTNLYRHEGLEIYEWTEQDHNTLIKYSRSDKTTRLSKMKLKHIAPKPTNNY